MRLNILAKKSKNNQKNILYLKKYDIILKKIYIKIFENGREALKYVRKRMYK